MLHECSAAADWQAVAILGVGPSAVAVPAAAPRFQEREHAAITR